MCNVLGNPKYRKVYLSGPITGMPNNNQEQFDKYALKFANMGLTVVNPLNIFDAEELKTFTWEQFMKKDIAAMMDCDFVAVLPNWERSKGANLEIHIAREVKMPIITATEFQELFKR